MAFSSMLLGGTMRPPYWNVCFRFCSHALAIPLHSYRKHYYSTILCVQCSTFTHCDSGFCVFFTLILCPSTAEGLLQVLEQERFEDFRAAMESRQDVQQPPATLAAITAQHKTAQTHSGSQLSEARGAHCVQQVGRLTVWSWC